MAGDFAGHSLRRGFITNAAKKKIPIESIKRVTGQRSNAIVLDYVAAATIDDDPPLLRNRFHYRTQHWLSVDSDGFKIAP